MLGFKELQITLEFPRYFIIGDRQPKTLPIYDKFVWEVTEFLKTLIDVSWEIAYNEYNVSYTIRFNNLEEFIKYQEFILKRSSSLSN